MPVATRSRKGSSSQSEPASASQDDSTQPHTPATTKKKGGHKASSSSAVGTSGASPAPVTPPSKLHSQSAQQAPSPSPASQKPPISNSQYIAQLRSKWQRPTTLHGRLRVFIQTMVFQTDYILGAYFFDWWETALVYPLYLVAILLVVYSVYRQGSHALDLASQLMHRYTQQ